MGNGCRALAISSVLPSHLRFHDADSLQKRFLPAVSRMLLLHTRQEFRDQTCRTQVERRLPQALANARRVFKAPDGVQARRNWFFQKPDWWGAPRPSCEQTNKEGRLPKDYLRLKLGEGSSWQNYQ